MNESTTKTPRSCHVFRRADDTMFQRELTLEQSESFRIVGTRYLIDDEEVIRDVQTELALAGHTPAERRRELAKYPIKSWSMGTSPARAEELRQKLLRETGTNCVAPDGRVIFQSDSHRRRIARSLGMAHSNSFLD